MSVSVLGSEGHAVTEKPREPTLDSYTVQYMYSLKAATVNTRNHEHMFYENV